MNPELFFKRHMCTHAHTHTHTDTQIKKDNVCLYENPRMFLNFKENENQDRLGMGNT